VSDRLVCVAQHVAAARGGVRAGAVDAVCGVGGGVAAAPAAAGV
jgi:hypothetical protein